MSKQQDDKIQRVNWLKNLYASGYAGTDKSSGEIVDRRTHLDAITLPQNTALGIIAPKPTSH